MKAHVLETTDRSYSPPLQHKKNFCISPPLLFLDPRSMLCTSPRISEILTPNNSAIFSSCLLICEKTQVDYLIPSLAPHLELGIAQSQLLSSQQHHQSPRLSGQTDWPWHKLSQLASQLASATKKALLNACILDSQQLHYLIIILCSCTQGAIQLAGYSSGQDIWRADTSQSSSSVRSWWLAG